MALKLHAHGSRMGSGAALSLCGWPGVLTTQDPEAVTCQLCRRRQREARTEEAHARGQLTGGKAYREAYDALSFLADVYLGQYEGPPLSTPRRPESFASISHALASMVLTDSDGWTLGSLGDPERLERMAGRLGGRNTGEDAPGPADYLDGIVTVRTAWVRAWRAVDPSPLTLAEAQAVTLLRYVGNWCAPTTVQTECGTRHLSPEEVAHARRQLSPREIAEALLERGVALSPKAIGRITGNAASVIYEYLREREMVPAMRRAKGGDSMAEHFSDCDLHGWEEIANFCGGVHVDTAKRYVAELGMPVYRFQGRVEAKSDELREWRQQQTKAAG